jgi:glycerol 2-dehydrogenase (NADP+)
MWGLNKGWSVIPKSVTPSRIEGNRQLDGWELTKEDIAGIDGIEDRFKVCDGLFLPTGVKVFLGDDE